MINPALEYNVPAGYAPDAGSGLLLPEMMEGEEKEDREASAERKALVARWLGKVERAKEHWKKSFKRMREDMKFAAGLQWPGQTELNDDRYSANFVLSHVQKKTASMYARNPKVIAKRRPRCEFSLWDEKPESLQTALQGAMAGDPNSMAVLQEVMQAIQTRKMYERVGKTMEILFSYYTDEQEPNFKLMLKQLVRRVITTGVGYVKVDFQREMGRSPDDEVRISDQSRQLAHLQRLADEAQEGELYSGMADLEELRSGLETLMSQPEILLREGLNFDFPQSTSVIIDPACTQIKGFVGANWIAQQYALTADQIDEIYDVDVKDIGGKEYGQAGALLHQVHATGDRKDSATYRVYEIYSKLTGQMLTVCDGAKDFLAEPAAPRVVVERFWPISALTFNDVEWADPEEQGDIFPPSDVRLLRAMQLEHNRSREGLREHRIANRPAYVGPANVLTKEDKDLLASHDVAEFIGLQNVAPGTDPNTVIRPLVKAEIDPAVYDAAPFFDDAQKVAGSQEANWGGVSGAAATEVSVAEGSRLSSIQSNVDDLDDLLSEVAQMASQVMLRELSPETVAEIAGPGAVWPTLTGGEIARELYLDIKAGSSGRPNKAMELANFERIAPILLQIPGIAPRMLAEEAVKRMDDSLDMSDWYVDMLPSVIAMNAASKAPQQGAVSSDPNAQGAEGGDNAEKPPEQAPQGQPSYPTAGDEAGVGG